MSFFETLKNQISMIRDNQANFQKVGLCHLASNGGKVSRISFAEAIKARNAGLSHEVSYYKSLSCPVYKVLKNKGLIDYDKESVFFTGELSQSQSAEISELCAGGMI